MRGLTRTISTLGKSATRALFLFLAMILTLSFSAETHAQLRFDKQPLTIETKAGQRYAFTVELALDSGQRQQGLMFREKMEPDAGMLFDFDEAREISMWMRNTLIPLDMLFIGEDGTIRHIHAGAVPHSEAIISSEGPVKFVLELNGGEAARRNIAVGDRVLSRQIGNTK